MLPRLPSCLHPWRLALPGGTASCARLLQGVGAGHAAFHLATYRRRVAPLMPLLLLARSTLPPPAHPPPGLHTLPRGSEDTNIDPANRKCSDRIRYSTNSDPRASPHPPARPSAPSTLAPRPRPRPRPAPSLGCFEAACAVAPMSFAVKSGPRLCLASWVSAGRPMARPSNANADSTPQQLPPRRLPLSTHCTEIWHRSYAAHPFHHTHTPPAPHLSNPYCHLGWRVKVRLMP